MYLGIDTETSGLEPGKHSVLEIGAVYLGDDFSRALRQPGPIFQALVRPAKGAAIDPKALSVNGLRWAADPESDEYQRAAPAGLAWSRFRSWVADLKPRTVNGRRPPLVLVGWNPSFDEGHLRALARISDDPRPWPFSYHRVDLMAVVRYLDCKAGRLRTSYSLDAMREALLPSGYRSKFGPPHSAVADLMTALEVLGAVEREGAQSLAHAVCH